MKKILQFIKNIFFPIVCISCQKDCGYWLCNSCKRELILDFKVQEYPDIPFKVYTIFKQNKVMKKFIHGLKYKFYAEASELLKRHISLVLKEIKDSGELILVPVPLHKNKLRKRGFNQVEKLLIEGYEVLKIRRISNTKSQMTLKKSERLDNMKNAFKCNIELSEEKTYVILDDVVTTATTIAELARELKNCGAKNILALTLTRGL